MLVAYTPAFIRQYKKFPILLRKEIGERIDLFKQDPKHPFLKTHKLKGSLHGRWSFSINYQYRIVFTHLSKDEALFHAVGDHDIYK